MGGLVCNIHRQAVLQFQSVPTDPTQTAAFDAQIRALYNAPSIAESVVSDTSMGDKVCAILAKTTFTHEDRETLLGVIESLYGSYA